MKYSFENFSLMQNGENKNKCVLKYAIRTNKYYNVIKHVLQGLKSFQKILFL